METAQDLVLFPRGLNVFVEKAMGILLRSFKRLTSAGMRCLAALLVLGFLSSCSIAPTSLDNRLLRSRAMLDFSGLKSVETISSVKIRAASPVGWERLPTKKTPLYTHEQWRSPSTHTGVGVAYVRMPLPLPADTLAWFAKQEYGKKSDDGKIIGQWTDDAGRVWFEVQNNKYHVRGYVLTRGLDAWIIYSGYRLTTAPDPAEISLALRSAETIVPVSAAPIGQPELARK